MNETLVMIGKLTNGFDRNGYGQEESSDREKIWTPQRGWDPILLFLGWWNA
jgi:hypothetical protein